MAPVNDFLTEIDRRWRQQTETKTLLRIIGSASLMLQTGYQRGTKDSDVLETDSVTRDLKTQLLELAGEGTDLHRRHKLYLDSTAAISTTFAR